MMPTGIADLAVEMYYIYTLYLLASLSICYCGSRLVADRQKPSNLPSVGVRNGPFADQRASSGCFGKIRMLLKEADTKVLPFPY